MDPDAALEVLDDPTRPKAERRHAAANLIAWIRDGGFPPRRFRKGDGAVEDLLAGEECIKHALAVNHALMWAP